MTGDPVLALRWLVLLGEMRVEDLAQEEGVTVSAIVRTCREYGWEPTTRAGAQRPDLHERLCLWNAGLSWAEVATECRYPLSWERLDDEVRQYARRMGYPIRPAKPYEGRNRHAC